MVKGPEKQFESSVHREKNLIRICWLEFKGPVRYTGKFVRKVVKSRVCYTDILDLLYIKMLALFYRT